MLTQREIGLIGGILIVVISISLILWKYLKNKNKSN